jgi:glycosyltransferase involved in cell wall biosynthesis
MNRFIIESERWAARITDRLVVVAAEDRKKGLAAGVGAPERYVLIESSIPLDTFDPSSVDVGAVRARLGIPDGAPVAGTVGRFAYQKAPEIMLEAARKILESQPDAHFVYVGDGPLRDEVLSMMGEFAGHPRLHLAGVVTDVAPLVAGFDVFLLSSRYEGLPRVVVEAMALEKPHDFHHTVRRSAHHRLLQGHRLNHDPWKTLVA